ncbi:hypothetical protein [uncultured Imperialibacter sp.]|uniref:hypothetical protein n=1 Tax=uncultured Imperialibacter sp. TaxID=1672639 RepID=UPI0030DB9945|tara:strand:+ start:71959 stop:72234 length:276 start_codon:yes stop_codon:yes gene_type:complete
MKLWAKILIGVQSLCIVFMLLYAFILASEATKQATIAEQQAQIAVAAQQEAEMQRRMAKENAEEALRQNALAAETAEQLRKMLEACESKKK